MEIRPEDLRIGNVVYYQTSEDGLQPNVIDIEDLRQLVSFPESFNKYYKGIPMNSDAIKSKLGLRFELDESGTCGKWSGFIGRYGVFELYEDGNGLFFYPNTTMGIRIEFFHQLQNALFFSTGDEFFPNTELLLEKLNPQMLVNKILSDGFNGKDLPF